MKAVPATPAEMEVLKEILSGIEGFDLFKYTTQVINAKKAKEKKGFCTQGS
jgi:hypothetical protein